MNFRNFWKGVSFLEWMSFVGNTHPKKISLDARYIYMKKQLFCNEVHGFETHI